MIRRLACWLFDLLFPRIGRPPRTDCPDFVDPPSFVVDAQRSRLDLEWEYDRLYDEWSRWVNDPDVIENTRTFLEHQWRR